MRRDRQVLRNGLAVLGVHAPRSGCEGAPGRAAARKHLPSRPPPARRRRSWARSTRRCGPARRERIDGELHLAGRPVTELAREHGTPLFVLDEADFRGRRRDFAAAFDDADVHYASKAFLCGQMARWVADEGLHLDACSGNELALALAAGFPAERIALHGNNKSLRSSRWPSTRASATSCVDSFDEIDRLAPAAARGRGGAPVPVLIRATVGIEAHTHEFIATAHEDQKFGFSLATGDALTAAVRVIREPALELAGLHSHIGSQIFDTAGFEAAAHRVVGLLGQVHQATGDRARRAQPRRRLRHRLPVRGRPGQPADVAARLRPVVAAECAAARPAGAAPRRRAGPRDRRPRHGDPLRGRHHQAGAAGRSGAPARRWCATTSPSTAA